MDIETKRGIPRNSSCLSHTASDLAVWPHLAGPSTMEYCLMHVAHKQYPGTRHQNRMHVRHMNAEADVAVYLWRASMDTVASEAVFCSVINPYPATNPTFWPRIIPLRLQSGWIEL